MSGNRNQRLRSVLILCLLGLVIGVPTHRAEAQQGTRSHRVLPLPENSPDQPQEQLARLLQFFKTLKGESPDSQPNDSSKADRTLSQLQRALGPEFSDLINQLPPGTINEAMKNPAVQSGVKDMLQRFSKDGTLPEFSTRKTPSPNHAEAPGETSKRAAADPSQPRNGDRSAAGRSPAGRSPSPGRPFNGARKDSSNAPSKARPTPHDRLNELMERFQERRSQNNKGSESVPAADDAQGQRGSRENNERTSEPDSDRPTDSELTARLRDLIEQQQRDAANSAGLGRQQNSGQDHRQPSGSNLSNATPSPSGSPSDSGGRPRFPRPANSNDEMGGSETGGGGKPPFDFDLNGLLGADSDSHSDSKSPQAAPSMSEFLDQVQDSPTPDLEEFGIDVGGRSGSAGQKGASGSLLADALSQMDSAELREQAKKALQNKGLRNTLKDILKNARQAAKEEANSGDSAGGGLGGIVADVASATGMEDTLRKTLGGMSKELIEAAKDMKFADKKESNSSQADDSLQADRSAQAGGTAQANSPATAADSTTETKSSEKKSVFQMFKESASSAIKSVSGSSDDPSDVSAAAVSTKASPSIFDTFSGTNLAIFLFFGLLIAILLVSLFYSGRLLPANQVESSEQVMAALLKQGIRCKEDVIRAFHQFALKPPHQAQNWWTHSRVVDAVMEQYPAQSARIQVLSALYEQARYLPDETEFTAAQIRQATEAVRIVGAV